MIFEIGNMRHYIPRSILFGKVSGPSTPRIAERDAYQNTDVAKFCLTITEDASNFRFACNRLFARQPTA